MPYFTWREQGLSSDCQSLEAIAARFEEAAALMRRLATQGFRVEHLGGEQRITHNNANVFEDFGFVDECGPGQQLELVAMGHAKDEGG